MAGENRRRSEARVARLADVLHAAEEPDSHPVVAPNFLDSAVAASGRPGSRIVAAAVSLALIIGFAATWVVTRAASAPTSGDTVVAEEAVPSQPASLELVSLTHERVNSGALELRGEVHDPENGTTLDDVTVVALLFDTQGAFLTSSRAPLATRTLVHGGTATFFISVPDATNVGRYRVSSEPATASSRIPTGGTITEVRT